MSDAGGNDYDAFISYAMVDNQSVTLGKEEPGWVRRFRDTLEKIVNMNLGRMARIWMTRDLRVGEPLDSVIGSAIGQAATLVVVLSKGWLASEFCRRELDQFLATHPDAVAQGRVFVAVVQELPREEWPAPLANLLGYEFFQRDPETGRTRLLGQLGMEAHKEAYYGKVSDLAHDLVKQLEALRRGGVEGRSEQGEHLLNRWESQATKRVLAIHGSMTNLPLALTWLEAIERAVGSRGEGDGLAGYFDLIAGAGGGALLAALLARGALCSTIRKDCEQFSELAVAKTGAVAQIAASLLGDRWLPGALKSVGGGRGRSATEVWRTGVCLHAFRLDDGTVHAFHNHPNDDRMPVESTKMGVVGAALEACLAIPPHPSRVLPMAASGAAKGTVRDAPEKTEAAEAVFGDARLGMAGGAAWSTLVVATSPRHPFQWPLGADRLLLVSVGTGTWTAREAVGDALHRNLLQQASRLPGMLLRDAAHEECWTLEGMAQTPRPRLAEAGAEGEALDAWFSEPALTWLRYELELDAGPLSALGLTPDDALLRSLREPSRAEDLVRMREVGQRAAAAQVKASDFPAAFDPVPAPTRVSR